MSESTEGNSGKKVAAVLFDKTGTLTVGKPTCLHITAVAAELPNSSTGGHRVRRELLQVLVAAEKGSEHPIAQSLVHYAEAQLKEQEQIDSLDGGEGGDLGGHCDGVADEPSVTLAVEGMMCGNCEAKVRGALEEVEGVREAVVDWEAGTAVVEGTAAGAVLVDAVEDTGKDARLVGEAPSTRHAAAAAEVHSRRFHCHHRSGESYRAVYWTCA